MGEIINGKKVIGGMLWRFAERLGAKGVSFVVSIVLARLLIPEVYGQIALITAITNVLEVFVDSGLGTSLIQKKDADHIDFSTVFLFNMVVCSVLYGAMFITAPFIATFYTAPELTPVIRVLSLTLIISGLKNVQHAYVSKHMLFKRFFFATLGGTIGAAVIGIALAYLGFGIWALVAQQLFNMILDTIILWVTVHWRPTWEFSFERLKGLFSYGWKILASRLVDTFYGELEAFVIGKVYTKSDLAFYNRGRTFPQLLVMNINSSIDSVLFPAMSSAQDDKERVKAMTRRAIQTSSYLMMPMMIGLYVIADSFIRVILNTNWLPCIPYVRVLCIGYMFYPINTANINAIRAIGRSDLFLKLDIVKKVIGVIFLIVALQLGPLAIAFGYLGTSALSQMINSIPNKKLLDYSYMEQLRDILPSTLLSVIMGVVVSIVGKLCNSIVFTLMLQISVGIGCYILLSIVFHLEPFRYVLQILQQKRSKKK